MESREERYRRVFNAVVAAQVAGIPYNPRRSLHMPEQNDDIVHIEAGLIERTARAVVFNYLVVHWNAPADVTVNDVVTVWSCKVLQNWKAILAAPTKFPGALFEVTFNGEKHEAYVDVYKKAEQQIVHFAPEPAVKR